MTPPQRKSDYYEAAQRLAFGNQLRRWPDLATAAAELDGPYGIRTKEPGGPTSYMLPYQVAQTRIEEYRRAGYTPVVSECSPDQELLIQGELQHTTSGLYLRYCTTIGMPMFAAFWSQDIPQYHVFGLTSRLLLRQHCRPKSLEMIEDLLASYDGAIIEFSAFQRCLGVIPGHNVVIWEVRGGY